MNASVRRRGAWLVMSAFAVGAQLVNAAAASAQNSGDVDFFTLPLCRLVDNPSLPAGLNVFQVTGNCGIPASATAVSVNITVVQPPTGGLVVIFPGDQNNTSTSVLNYNAGQTTTNNSIAPLALNGSGTLGLRTSQSAHFTIDVNGYFSADTTPAPLAQGPFQYTSLPGCRLVNTGITGNPIPANGTLPVSVKGVCGVSATAAAAHLVSYSGGTSAASAGSVLLYPSNAQPSGSFATASFPAGGSVQNSAITALGAAPGDLSELFASSVAGAGANVIVDVHGFFGAGERLHYHPIAGCRAVDTRLSNMQGPSLAGGSIRMFSVRAPCGIPATAEAAFINVTVADQTGGGLLRVISAADPNVVGNGTNNFAAGPPRANGTIVRLGQGGTAGQEVQVLAGIPAGTQTDVILDVMGYFEPGPTKSPKGTGEGEVAQAPGLERGFAPEKSYQVGEVDSVNLLNGNVSLHIPIGGSFAVGGGLSYSLNLAYNSKIWDFKPGTHTTPQTIGPIIDAAALPHRAANAGVGWLLTLGELIDPCDPDNNTAINPQAPNPGDFPKWVYVDPEGGEHNFYGDLNYWPNNQPQYPGVVACLDDPGSSVYYSRDSTYLRLQILNRQNLAQIEFPDGTIEKFERLLNEKWLLTQIRNRFVDSQLNPTNHVDISYANPDPVNHPEDNPDPHYNPRIWTITDSAAGAQGRKITVHLEDDPSGNYDHPLVREVDLTAFNGAAAKYAFLYETQSIYRECNSTRPNLPNPLAVSLLQVLQLPDNVQQPDQYTFQYNPPTGPYPFSPACENSGLLSFAQLPTRGTISWAYRTYTMPTPACTFHPHVRTSAGVWTRTYDDGNGNNGAPAPPVWTYVPALSQPPPLSNQTCEDTGPLGRPYAPPSEEMTNTVTDPLQNQVVNYFSVWPPGQPVPVPSAFDPVEYGLPLTRFTHCDINPDCAAAGNNLLSTLVYQCLATNPTTGACTSYQLKRSNYVQYDHDRPALTYFSGVATVADGTDVQRRPTSRRTVYEDDVADPTTTPKTMRFADTLYSDFDGFGHYRTTTNGGNFSGANVRSETTDYNPGSNYYLDPGSNSPAAGFNFNLPAPSAPWLLDTRDNHTVAESGSQFTDVSTFDPQTGFLNQHRVLANRPGTSDVVKTYSHDANGNVTMEQYSGADAGRVYTILHSYQYGVMATTQHQGALYKNLDLDIDPYSGLAIRSRDTAGLPTAYNYDNMDRLVSITPGGAGAPTGVSYDAWTEFVYRDAGASFGYCADGSPNPESGETCASVLVRKHTADGSLLPESEIVVDGFGRKWIERQRLPDGTWNQRETLYNGMGWKTYAGELVPAPTDPTKTNQATGDGTTFTGYDAFGRPATETLADGHQIIYQYTGVSGMNRGVRIQQPLPGGGYGERTVFTSELYDRQGRAAEFQEQAGPNGEVVKTDYTYDAGGRVTQVTQGCCGQSQRRTFGYDGLGLLRSETNPEHNVSYGSYDARGHLLQKTDGQNNLQLAYDPEERLTDVTAVGTGLLKHFVYDQGASSINWSLGKLSTGTRYNYVKVYAPGGAPHIVRFDESYTYDGRQGRTSYRDTSQWLDQNTTPSTHFTQSFFWTDLGETDTVDYPQCDPAKAPCSASPRDVKLSYQAGFLTQVGSQSATYATLTYHPNRVVARVQYSPAEAWVQDIDTVTNMARPRAISSSQGGSIGPYAYDGEGNVAAIGGELYAYDGANRVVLGQSGGGVKQTYGYDAFGNLVQKTAADSGMPVMMATDPATNHLSAASYDAAGNMITWGSPVASQSYDYDAVDRMIHFCSTSPCSSGQEWFYLYDANDERIWSFSPGRRDHFTLRDLDGKVLRRYEAQNYVFTPPEDYIYRHGTAIAAETPAGTKHFYVDQLGSPRLVTDGQGGSRVLHYYFPFGEEMSPPLPESDPLAFAGHERDLNDPSSTADDLDYLHARFYNPQIGRFLSADSAAGQPGRPSSWHRYTYTSDNPVNLIDPTGNNDANVNPPEGPQFPANQDDLLKVLGPDWTLEDKNDPGTHQDDASKRYKGPGGKVIDATKGKPGQTGEKGRDHYHVYRPGPTGKLEKDKNHFLPGQQIPPDFVAPTSRLGTVTLKLVPLLLAGVEVLRETLRPPDLHLPDLRQFLDDLASYHPKPIPGPPPPIFWILAP
jgi:RHS repeat-associated protein